MRIDARLLCRALAATGAAGAIGAHAETSPYALGANVSVSHDSNVFRSSDEPVSDTIRSVGVVASVDQPVGRQRLYANVSLSANRHVRLERLDDTSYAINGGVDWATLGLVTGTVRYAAARSLADYGVADVPRTDEKNIQRTQQAVATARWSLHSRLSVDASFEHRSLEYSAEAYRPFAYRQDVAGLALRFGSAGPLFVSVGGRATSGTTPNFQVGPGRFEKDRLERSDVDLSASWRAVRTGVTARLSLSHESHSQEASPAFTGLTGAIDADFSPTAKLRFDAGFSRDTGSATTFARFAPTAAQVQIDTDRLSTAAHVGARFAVTPKIALSAQARVNRGDVSSAFGAQRDRIASYEFAARFEPLRFLTLSCSVAREVRSSSVEGAGSGASVVGCSALGQLR